MASCEDVLSSLRSLADPEVLAGLSRFGINSARAVGVTIPKLRSLARTLGHNHELAQQLWTSGIHEARVLASMVDDPLLVTGGQMDAWVRDFDSWDLCDQCCGNLFGATGFAYQKAMEWSGSADEWVKRAGFVLMAERAVRDKLAPDDLFLPCLERIRSAATDDRNFVKKAVNWALRQIGKRNGNLNALAIQTARELQVTPSRAARWIASDALRELTSASVQARLRAKESRSSARGTGRDECGRGGPCRGAQ